MSSHVVSFIMGRTLGREMLHEATPTSNGLIPDLVPGSYRLVLMMHQVLPSKAQCTNPQGNELYFLAQTELNLCYVLLNRIYTKILFFLVPNS